MENNIKKARKAKGFTQIELANMIGASQGNLSSWESGRWAPEKNVLKKLCEVLDCTSDYLLGLKIDNEINKSSVSNIYLHLAKEMEYMQLPEADVNAILEFARYMKKKNDEK